MSRSEGFQFFKDVSYKTDKIIDRPELTGKVEKRLINDPIVNELFKVEQNINGSMREGCIDQVKGETRDKLLEVRGFVRHRAKKRINKLLKGPKENIIFESK